MLEDVEDDDGVHGMVGEGERCGIGADHGEPGIGPPGERHVRRIALDSGDPAARPTASHQGHGAIAEGTTDVEHPVRVRG